MTHSKKLERWISFAKENNFKKSIYQPPVDLILRKLKIKQPPVIFWSFWKITLFLGLYFGTTWGLVMRLIAWNDRIPILIQLVAAVSSGLFFGIFMAWHFRRTKKKLKLPEWEEFK